MTARVVVVIATRDRPRLLARALRSVAAQTRAPDAVVVVDDGARPVVVPEGVLVIPNRRTPGASGAWNTAIHAIGASQPRETFLAFLDDDDAWRPRYLERCVERQADTSADLVAADLSFVDERGAHPFAAPDRLRVDDVLVTNPGVQGSNLFVRLDCILSVGGFDEALPSTTDRDLLVRLIDDGLTYRRLPDILVDIYAERGRSRLSTPGSAVKREGLELFFAKHRHRMRLEQQIAFVARARRVFGCDVRGPRARYRAEGTVVARRVLDRAQVDALRAELPQPTVRWTRTRPGDWIGGLSAVRATLRAMLRGLVGAGLVPVWRRVHGPRAVHDSSGGVRPPEAHATVVSTWIPLADQGMVGPQARLGDVRIIDRWPSTEPVPAGAGWWIVWTEAG